nr:hypothetical protein [Halococcus sediminicola]
MLRIVPFIMSNQDDTREQGIEFGELEETMGSLDYPIEHNELVEQHGDIELEAPGGSSTLAEILEPLQDQEQTYHDASELETMIKNMVSEDAIGREGYSDRGTSPDQDDQESL